MNNKTRISLFPYNHDTDFVCKYVDEMPNFNIYSVISYQGSGKQKELCNGIINTDQAFGALQKSDGIFLSDNIQRFGRKAYINRIKDARELKKTILLSSYMYQWLGKEEFKDTSTIILNDFKKEDENRFSVLKSINCPIIGVFGIGENCDKWKVLLELKRNFEKQNYNVLAICANPLGKLLGCELLPTFLFDEYLSYSSKIFITNHYVYNLVKRYKPDIVLISSAGGLMYLHELEHNFFGEISRILLSALEFDYGIMCTYLNPSYTAEYFEIMQEACYNQFGVDILGFYISGQKCRIAIDGRQVDFDFYDDFYRQENFPLELIGNRNIFMKEQIGEIVDQIIESLTGNIEMI